MARARPKQAAAITGGQTADVRHRGNQGTKHQSLCVVEPNCSIDLHLAVTLEQVQFLATLILETLTARK
jgi:hypothetical protein